MLLTRKQLLLLAGITTVTGCGGSNLTKTGGSGTVLTASRLIVNPTASTITNDRGVNTSFLGYLGTPTGSYVSFWGTQDTEGVPTRLTQALFWDSNPLTGVRVLFDGQGLPIRVEHDENGAFVLIFWESDRATFKFYQPSGAFIGGSVITESGTGFDVTQLAGSAIVGYFSGRINGLRDAIVTFTVGGTATATSAITSRGQRVELTTRAETELTTEEKEQAKKAVNALNALATITQSGFAGRLLQAITQPLLEGQNSELGTRIIRTALNGTGLSPLFLRDGRPILDGLTSFYLLRQVAGQMHTTLTTEGTAFPTTLTVAYASPPVIAYKAGNAFKTTQPNTDSTGIRGIAASRETGNVPVSGYIDAGGNVYLSGTTTAGELLELRGKVENDAIRGGTWQLKDAPTPTRQESGDWNADETPLGQCTQQQNSGGQGIFSNTYDLGKCGDFPFSYQAYSIPDQFQIYQDDNLLFDTGGKISGGSTVTVTAVGQTTLIRVVVTADLSGTAWNYTVGCPQ